MNCTPYNCSPFNGNVPFNGFNGFNNAWQGFGGAGFSGGCSPFASSFGGQQWCAPFTGTQNCYPQGYNYGGGYPGSFNGYNNINSFGQNWNTPSFGWNTPPVSQFGGAWNPQSVNNCFGAYPQSMNSCFGAYPQSMNSCFGTYPNAWNCNTPFSSAGNWNCAPQASIYGAPAWNYAGGCAPVGTPGFQVQHEAA